VVRARVFSVAVPFVTTGLWFLALAIDVGVRWPAELWTGTIILACLEGAGLGLLAFPSDEKTTTPGELPVETVAAPSLEA
jgi:hypothetical protein